MARHGDKSSVEKMNLDHYSVVLCFAPLPPTTTKQTKKDPGLPGAKKKNRIRVRSAQNPKRILVGFGTFPVTSKIETRPNRPV